MEVLVKDIRKWFDAKREYLAAFACADCRVEGWFKGELLVLFDQLQRTGRLERFEREANVPVLGTGRRTQVDFRLSIKNAVHLCELKALCISRAAGTPRNLKFYFRDDHVGLLKDFRKLDSLQGTNKWLIAFVYPRPQVDDWDAAVNSLPTELRHWGPITSPNGAANDLFVSLWRPTQLAGTPE